MKIASWNVNSLRVRMPHLAAWLAHSPVDVLGIQETKLQDDLFPFAELEAAGYQAVHSGQKTYNGVALLSRLPMSDISRDIPGFADEQKRVIAATVGDVRIVNVYVVNGQALDSEKYAYKLRFLAALRDYLKSELERYPKLALLGDFNIAPGITDTHDPAIWEGGILCSDAERAGLQALLGLGMQDSYQLTGQPPGRFTWWDYRQAAFRRNMGLRIDHVLVSSALGAQCKGWNVDVAPRKLDRPSDHAPVIAEFAPG